MYRRVMYRDGLMAVVLVAVAVTMFSAARTPTYEASAQVWVKQNDWQTNLAGSKEFPTAHVEAPALMAHAIDSRPVAEKVIGRLGLRMKPDKLLDNLVAQQVENTNFIDLTYAGTDPQKAQHGVNTAGQVAAAVISGEGAAGSRQAATVYEEAVVPGSLAIPKP